MKKRELKKLKVGDKIKFRTWNRDGYKTGIRPIVSISSMGIGVNFFGWRPFFLKPEEIIEKVVD